MLRVDRVAHRNAVRDLLSDFPVVALIGARQVGKTTLAHDLAAEFNPSTFFDLEDPRDVAKLASPMLALEPLRGLVVLDEVQHRPDLFAALRVLADRRPVPARFLVLGSASPVLLRQSAESLAGRIAHHELPGLDLTEVGAEEGERLWLRGGFPLAYLAASDALSGRWRREFIRTYLERDLASLGIDLKPPTMRRFWSMVAHYHGQKWNAAEFARAFGVGEKAVRRYLDILCGTFMAFRLQPWFENLGKRQVKAPKIYLNDSGVLHSLLSLPDRESLLGHPKVGASWEGFAIQQVVRRLGAFPEECFFWGVHTGAELDLLVVRGRTRLGFEMKFTDSPATSRGMRSARETLELDRIDIVHAGATTFALDEHFRALALRSLGSELSPLP